MSDPAPFVPGYWMHETSGKLREAVQAYLNHVPMTIEQIGYMRAYLRQWMRGNWYLGIDTLRADIDGLVTQEAIKQWLDEALELGIDPL